MSFFRVSTLAFFVSFSRLLANVVVNKVLALYASPSSLAVFAQFQTFMQVGLAVGQGGVNTGIVKYTAEYSDGREEYDVYVSTAGSLSILFSLTISIVIFAFAEPIARLVFGASEHFLTVRLFSLALPFAVLNLFLLSVLNGLGKFSAWTSLNLIQTLLYLGSVAGLVFAGSFVGALAALSMAPIVYFVVTALTIKDDPMLRLSRFRLGLNKEAFFRLLSFSFMTFVGAISAPLTIMTIRNQIGQVLGWDSAGIWQGMWFISTAFSSLATGIISVYFLPRFSSSTTWGDLRRDVKTGFMLITPAVLVIATSIYLSKEILISVFFTKDFTPMAGLLLWQLIGDSLKILACFLAYALIAKSQVSSYVLAELAVSALLILSTIASVQTYGLVGASYSYATVNFVYLLLMLAMVIKLVKGESDVFERNSGEK